MEIAIIGTGYVGLVSGACLSEFGFNVTCIDKNKKKIDDLNNDIIPIYEPGLDDLVRKNRNAGRLKFSINTKEIIPKSDIVFIAVGTPSRRGDGHADLTYIYEASNEISLYLKGYTVIVTKSTVPVGTGQEVEDIIKKGNPDAEFDIVSNPEFLREGSAINDFMRPDRVIIGTKSKRAKDLMKIIYQPLFIRETPILYTDLQTSELIKYAANAFLALKISFINQIADLCETVNAEVHDVAKGIGLDKRIGEKYLHPGPGYGGSCFPKDTVALVETANKYNSPMTLIQETIRYNNLRKRSMLKRIIEASDNSIKDKKIAVLGLAFKPETDDVRESPALEIIPKLVSLGAKISTYDPVAMKEAKKILPVEVHYSLNAKSCIEGSDILVLLTEWNEFRSLNGEHIKNLMKGNVVVDLRNVFKKSKLIEHGIDYFSIG